MSDPLSPSYRPLADDDLVHTEYASRTSHDRELSSAVPVPALPHGCGSTDSVQQETPGLPAQTGHATQSQPEPRYSSADESVADRLHTVQTEMNSQMAQLAAQQSETQAILQAQMAQLAENMAQLNTRMDTKMDALLARRSNRSSPRNSRSSLAASQTHLPSIEAVSPPRRESLQSLSPTQTPAAPSTPRSTSPPSLAVFSISRELPQPSPPAQATIAQLNQAQPQTPLQRSASKEESPHIMTHQITSPSQVLPPVAIARALSASRHLTEDSRHRQQPVLPDVLQLSRRPRCPLHRDAGPVVVVDGLSAADPAGDVLPVDGPQPDVQRMLEVLHVAHRHLQETPHHRQLQNMQMRSQMHIVKQAHSSVTAPCDGVNVLYEHAADWLAETDPGLAAESLSQPVDYDRTPSMRATTTGATASIVHVPPLVRGLCAPGADCLSDHDWGVQQQDYQLQTAAAGMRSNKPLTSEDAVPHKLEASAMDAHIDSTFWHKCGSPLYDMCSSRIFDKNEEAAGLAAGKASVTVHYTLGPMPR